MFKFARNVERFGLLQPLKNNAKNVSLNCKLPSLFFIKLKNILCLIILHQNQYQKDIQTKFQIKFLMHYLDNFLAQDPNSKVACETLVTTGLNRIKWRSKNDRIM